MPLNTKLINDLLTILNQVNPNLQFIMERSTKNLPFLNIFINKTGTKIWMDIYNPKDLCLLHQITHKVASLFCFVWLSASVL